MRPFQPIIQPEVPFVARLESTLEPECLVTIDGFTPSYAEGFQVNFAAGPNYDLGNRSPTALHFNPRFNQNEICRNTYQPSSGWGPEERAGTMTLVKEHPFQLAFLVQPNSFKPMPFDYPIRSWMGLGKVITIVGHPKSNPERFHVDLYNQTTGDILMHFNPRFGAKRYVVRNSYIGGKWGDEQTETPFCYFKPEVKFHLKIACEPDFFTVYTNEQLFCYFVHRLPFNQATNIRIIGDVDVDSITFT